VKRKAQDLIGMIIYGWSTRKYKPRPQIRFMQTAPTAVGLHRQMYSAFAEGDSNTLKTICADGLLENFQARIQSRGRETLKWELIKYNRKSKVMSNRSASLGMEGIMIRQAVVRINSQQKLTRFKPDGSIVPGTGEVKDVQEYVVIQKKLLQGKEDDWVVWGTTEETTLESIKDEERRALE
jgi:protein MBA1